MPEPFQPRFVDLVRNLTTTQGTGNIVLGAAVSGFSSFTPAILPGERFYYSIIGIDKPAEREVGRGTMQANGTIAREPISGTLTNFTNGSKSIALIAAAEWFGEVQAALGQAGGGPGGSIGVASRTALAARASSETPAVLLETGREGLFKFDASNLSAKVAADGAQGIHVAPASAPSGASGAWVRQYSGPINVKWFGAVGNNVADDQPAIQAALDYVEATGSVVYGHGGAHVLIPRTTGQYFCGAPLDIHAGLVLSGENGGSTGGSATTLRFVDTQGIRIQRYNTSGLDGYDAILTHGAGDGSIIRHLTLVGNRTVGYTADSDAHGIVMRARATIEHCNIYDFKGDGIYIFAVAGALGPGEGNANLFTIASCTVQSCRNGLNVNGPDANAGVVTMLNATGNRRWGIWDSSFLGNTYIGCHADANALHSDGMAVAAHGGNLYAVIPGQEAGASTNAPSGAATTNTWWMYLGAGAAALGFGRRTWVSGMTWFAGGAYCTDDINAQTVITGCYAESGQAPSQLTLPTLVVGGMHATGVYRLGTGAEYGGYLVVGSSGNEGIFAPRDLRVGHTFSVLGETVLTGGLTANGGILATGFNCTGQLDVRGVTNQIGPQSGTNDVTLNLNSRTFGSTLNFKTINTLDGYVAALTGNGLYIEGIPAIRFYAAGGLIALVSGAGMAVTGAITATGALSGSNLAGTNTGDQFASIAALSVLGNGANAAAAAAPVAASADGQVLRRSGTALGFGAIATPGIADQAVTYAKLQNLSAPSILLGRATAGAGAVEEIGLANGLAMSGLVLGMGAVTPSSVVTAGALTSSGTAGNGYSPGAGGTVTQATNKSTAVTLNKICGRITMHNASLAASTSVSFTLTNSTIAGSDVVLVNIGSGGATNAYFVIVDAVTAGSCRIHLRNISAGALGEALALNFAVTKAVIA